MGFPPGKGFRTDFLQDSHEEAYRRPPPRAGRTSPWTIVAAIAAIIAAIAAVSSAFTSSASLLETKFEAAREERATIRKENLAAHAKTNESIADLRGEVGRLNGLVEGMRTAER